MALIVNITGWPRVSGVRASIVLTPGDEPRVDDTYVIGNGTPMAVYCNRELAFGVRPDAVPEDIAEWVEAHAEDFLALAVCYQGAEWDGNNMIGCWSEDADDLTEKIQQDLDEAQNGCSIRTYWEADSWLSGNSHGVLQALLDDLRAGRTVADAAEREHGQADGAALDRDDLERSLQRRLDEYMQELLDDIEVEIVEREITTGGGVEYTLSMELGDGESYDASAWASSDGEVSFSDSPDHWASDGLLDAVLRDKNALERIQRAIIEAIGDDDGGEDEDVEGDTTRCVQSLSVTLRDKLVHKRSYPEGCNQAAVEARVMNDLGFDRADLLMAVFYWSQVVVFEGGK